MYQLERTQVSDIPLYSDVDKLELHLQAQLSGRIRCLQLVREDAGIVLRGSARTYHAKQLAQHAVMRMTELPILANEIDVF